jgi:transposase InsO family protein
MKLKYILFAAFFTLILSLNAQVNPHAIGLRLNGDGRGNKMCKVFKVSRSRFYEWRNYIPSNHDNENRALLFEIRRIHEQSKASYGSPRITDELKSRGFKASKPRVARLMKKNGIRAVHAKKFVVTTDSKHKYPVVENKLDRNFSAQKSAQVWVSDITYIRTMKGWLYLTIILDLYDRKVIGWALSTDMSAENTTIAAWRMAIKNREQKYRINMLLEMLTDLKLIWEADLTNIGDILEFLLLTIGFGT